MPVQIRPRDKFAINAALLILSLVAWASIFQQSQRMSASDAAPNNMMELRFVPPQLMLYLSTWVVMMAAMMLPASAPLVITFAAMSQQGRSKRPVYISIGLLILGYLLIWGGTGLVAFTVSTLTPMMVRAIPELTKYSGLIDGAILIMVGAYQWSPLKNVCLSQCRTPLGYFMTHWRDGHSGTLLMGLQHGWYCIGCCWALMTILFVVGVMNLAWMAALSLFIYIEKVSVRGVPVGKVMGILLIGVGMVMSVRSIL